MSRPFPTSFTPDTPSEPPSPREGPLPPAPQAASSAGGPQQLSFHLPGLACRACARRAEAVLGRVPGVLAARVRVARERAEVRFDARRTSAGELVAALELAGFAVAAVPLEPPGGTHAIDLGVGLAALANVLLLGRAGGAEVGAVALAQAVCAAVALAVAGAAPARRAVGLLRRGLLGREALAGAAALACFAAGLLELALARMARVPPWLAALGAGVSGPTTRGAGFEAAATLAVTALVAHVAEAALYRRALRDLVARRRARAAPPRLDAAGRAEVGPDLVAGDPLRLDEGDAAPADLRLDGPARTAQEGPGGVLIARLLRPGDVMPAGAVLLSGPVTGCVVPRARASGAGGDARDALDLEAHEALSRLALARVEPPVGTWDDAAVRGVVTAALGLTSFALVTHGWLGAGPLSPLAVLSAAAVLAAASPSAILASAPAARAAALLAAWASGIAVRDPAALETLAAVDTACLDRSGPLVPSIRAVHGLRARGVRVLALDGASHGAPRGTSHVDRPPARAPAIRDLQLAGARVLLVGGDPAAAAQADVAVATTPASAAPLVVMGGHLDALPALVDLGRALRGVRRRGAALGAVYNAVLLPAAALGHVSPALAAVLALAETLFGLLDAARLLRGLPRRS